MNDALDRLARLLDTVPARLSALSDAQAAARGAEGRWSPKEILGHLIDSASNNHQRFVRSQFAPVLEIPNYQQDSWVAAQGYSAESWTDLVALWAAYNRHLLHIAARIPADCLRHTISIGGRPAVPLETVITDYVGHLEHHLGQIPNPG